MIWLTPILRLCLSLGCIITIDDAAKKPPVAGIAFVLHMLSMALLQYLGGIECHGPYAYRDELSLSMGEHSKIFRVSSSSSFVLQAKPVRAPRRRLLRTRIVEHGLSCGVDVSSVTVSLAAQGTLRVDCMKAIFPPREGRNVQPSSPIYPCMYVIPFATITPRVEEKLGSLSSRLLSRDRVDI